MKKFYRSYFYTFFLAVYYILSCSYQSTKKNKVIDEKKTEQILSNDLKYKNIEEYHKSVFWYSRELKNIFSLSLVIDEAKIKDSKSFEILLRIRTEFVKSWVKGSYYMPPIYYLSQQDQLFLEILTKYEYFYLKYINEKSTKLSHLKKGNVFHDFFQIYNIESLYNTRLDKGYLPIILYSYNNYLRFKRSTSIYNPPIYKMIKREYLNKAIALVKNQSDSKQRNWCCGPNSALRAIYLIGKNWYKGYNNYIDNCPRILHGNTAKVFLGVYTLGISILLDLIINRGFTFKWDVGPTTKQLSRYINSNIPEYFQAHNKGYKKFDHFTYDIKKGIDKGLPTIILIIYGSLMMHYVNIIGYKKRMPVGDYLNKNNLKYFDREISEGDIEEVIILDTDSEVIKVSVIDLEKWMNSKGYATMSNGNYYDCILFTKP